jgi:hypothetical protein
MPTSQNGKVVPEEILKSLEITTTLIQNLLGDIKEHSTSLAMVKTKLEALSVSVSTLSGVVRDGNGNGSLVTRLALAEKTIEDIEKSFNDLKEEVEVEINELREYFKKKKAAEDQEKVSERDFNREKRLARLKIVAVAAPGLLALVLMLIKMLSGETPSP